MKPRFDYRTYLRMALDCIDRALDQAELTTYAGQQIVRAELYLRYAVKCARKEGVA